MKDTQLQEPLCRSSVNQVASCSTDDVENACNLSVNISLWHHRLGHAPFF